MKSIYGRVTVPEKSTEFFREKGPMTIVCISEDWCPDCAQNVPLIVRLTERLPGTSVRFFFRDRNGALMDHYQTSGKRVVPTAVFFDSELNELGKWAGPSRKAKAWTNETLIRGRQISEIPRKELEEFGSLYDEKFLNEFYLDTLDELKSALG
ncbi:MAG: thioredoxin family protein [Bacteroidetes bacterium]|nr:thioredoxin family protein [Bacteroidota bacterium]